MKHIKITETQNFLIEFEIWNENDFDILISTEISLHSLISGENLTDGFRAKHFKIL